MDGGVIQPDDRLDDDVVALLGVKPRDAPDDVGVYRDVQTLTHRGPTSRAEADAIHVDRVRNDDDLVLIHPDLGNRGLGSGGDGHHEACTRGCVDVRQARQPAAQRVWHRSPLRPCERGAHPPRQPRRHELLLLVVHEQDVVGQLPRKFLTKSEDVLDPMDAQGSDGARGQLGPDVDRLDGHTGVSPDVVLIAEHDDLMASLGQRVEHLDGGELCATGRTRGHYADDLQASTFPLRLDERSQRVDRVAPLGELPPGCAQRSCSLSVREQRRHRIGELGGIGGEEEVLVRKAVLEQAGGVPAGDDRKPVARAPRRTSTGTRRRAAAERPRRPPGRTPSAGPRQIRAPRSARRTTDRRHLARRPAAAPPDGYATRAAGRLRRETAVPRGSDRT